MRISHKGLRALQERDKPPQVPAGFRRFRIKGSHFALAAGRNIGNASGGKARGNAFD